MSEYEERDDVDILKENLKNKKITKDKGTRATVENVLDQRTLRFVNKLIYSGIIQQLNGCLSTGKEANVYHAFEGDLLQPDMTLKKQYAVKIYKTSILIFKDRERYINGEFRFRNNKNQHNPRKLIKIWAEKEFRNLKRIYSYPFILCPKPIDIKNNVLVMEFLGDYNIDATTQPALKLKDYDDYETLDDVYSMYYKVIAYIRILYRVCRLVHADLSEYNTLVFNDDLYMIDVSQSVEPEHPMSLDFLRMDIKNINLFFRKKFRNLVLFNERDIFQFVITEYIDEILEPELINNRNRDEYLKFLMDYIPKNIGQKLTIDDVEQDKVYRNLYLVRDLNGLEEKDFDRFTDGKFDLLKQLVASHNKKYAGKKLKTYDIDGDDDEDDDDDLQIEDASESEEEEEESDEDSDYEYYEEEEHIPRGKRFEDKDAKKQRKEEAKEAKREKRQNKMKKHLKKKLVNKTKHKKA
ncbi:protein kinase [Hanseniaspora uvarum]|nr:protein kinase [Hanseniaspora uvarum]